MRGERSEASAKLAPVQLGGEPVSQSAKAPENQLGDALASVLGGASVRVERRASETSVKLVNRPWGWPNLDRILLGSGRGADRYAARLWAMLAEAASKELERQERQQVAIIREAVHRRMGAFR